MIALAPASTCVQIQDEQYRIGLAYLLPSHLLATIRVSTIHELNISTLNCWGLKYLPKFRRERLSEIGRQLATQSSRPDIVGLQECWCYEDYLSIHESTRVILPYAKFYYSGVFGVDTSPCLLCHIYCLPRHCIGVTTTIGGISPYALEHRWTMCRINMWSHRRTFRDKRVAVVEGVRMGNRELG